MKTKFAEVVLRATIRVKDLIFAWLPQKLLKKNLQHAVELELERNREEERKSQVTCPLEREVFVFLTCRGCREKWFHLAIQSSFCIFRPISLSRSSISIPQKVVLFESASIQWGMRFFAFFLGRESLLTRTTHSEFMPDDHTILQIPIDGGQGHVGRPCAAFGGKNAAVAVFFRRSHRILLSSVHRASPNPVACETISIPRDVCG